MATRLFFGFEYRHPHLAVVAVDGQGTLLLRARFPLLDPSDSELTDGAAPRQIIVSPGGITESPAPFKVTAPAGKGKPAPK